MPRNDGFMMFYNPTLHPVAESVIQSVDVAPTMVTQASLSTGMVGGLMHMMRIMHASVHKR